MLQVFSAYSPTLKSSPAQPLWIQGNKLLFLALRFYSTEAMFVIFQDLPADGQTFPGYSSVAGLLLENQDTKLVLHW